MATYHQQVHKWASSAMESAIDLLVLQRQRIYHKANLRRHHSDRDNVLVVYWRMSLIVFFSYFLFCERFFISADLRPSCWNSLLTMWRLFPPNANELPFSAIRHDWMERFLFLLHLNFSMREPTLKFFFEHEQSYHLIGRETLLLSLLLSGYSISEKMFSSTNAMLWWRCIEDVWIDHSLLHPQQTIRSDVSSMTNDRFSSGLNVLSRSLLISSHVFQLLSVSLLVN